MPEVKEPLDELDSLMRNQASDVRKAFYAYASAVTSRTALATLLEHYRRGNLSEILDYIKNDYDEVITKRAEQYIETQLNKTRRDSINHVRKFMANNINVNFTYGGANTRGLRAFNLHNQRFIKDITKQQKLNVRKAVRKGLSEGVNPNDFARIIRTNLNLTDKQNIIINNYRKELNNLDDALFDRALHDKRFSPTIRRAIKTKKKLSPQYVETVVKRYHDRFLAYRARTIARTEGMRALNEGRQSAMQEAVESDEWGENEIRRHWLTSVDGRERDSHRALNGQVRRLNEPFKPKLMYPHDPLADPEEVINCRCRLRMVIISPEAGF